jgi:hypothetical protein
MKELEERTKYILKKEESIREMKSTIDLLQRTLAHESEKAEKFERQAINNANTIGLRDDEIAELKANKLNLNCQLEDFRQRFNACYQDNIELRKELAEYKNSCGGWPKHYKELIDFANLIGQYEYKGQKFSDTWQALENGMVRLNSKIFKQTDRAFYYNFRDAVFNHCVAQYHRGLDEKKGEVASLKGKLEEAEKQLKTAYAAGVDAASEYYESIFDGFNEQWFDITKVLPPIGKNVVIKYESDGRTKEAILIINQLYSDGVCFESNTPVERYKTHSALGVVVGWQYSPESKSHIDLTINAYKKHIRKRCMEDIKGNREEMAISKCGIDPLHGSYKWCDAETYKPEEDKPIEMQVEFANGVANGLYHGFYMNINGGSFFLCDAPRNNGSFKVLKWRYCGDKKHV